MNINETITEVSIKMVKFNYVITDEVGIHARPAGLLVKTAQQLKSKVTITKGEKSGDAKKIFSIMSLCAMKGDEITVTVEGEDEAEGAEILEKFFKENL